MSPAEAAVDRRENVFLRWLIVGMLAGLITLGGVVWNRVANETADNTRELREHKLAIQRLELDAAADRRSTSVLLAGIQQWLQAIGQRLNVAVPPPSSP